MCAASSDDAAPSTPSIIHPPAWRRNATRANVDMFDLARRIWPNTVSRCRRKSCCFMRATAQHRWRGSNSVRLRTGSTACANSSRWWEQDREVAPCAAGRSDCAWCYRRRAGASGQSIDVRVTLGHDRSVSIEVGLKGSDTDRPAGTAIFDARRDQVDPTRIAAMAGPTIAYITAHVAVAGAAGKACVPGRPSSCQTGRA